MIATTMKRIEETIFPSQPGECHASTLLELPDGGFLAAWFSGSKEGRADVRIHWSRRDPLGGWSVPETVPPAGEEPHWNPVLFLRPDGRIALCFKLGTSIADWRTFQCFWLGSGWSVPQELVPGDNSGGRGPVKNKPIRLADGRLLAPASVERGVWRSFVDCSSDGGDHWVKSPPVPVESLALDDPHSGNRLGVIQPVLWESSKGKIHMLLRSNHGRLYRSDSCDGGVSWQLAAPTSLANNNSGIDLTRLPDGTLLLATNSADSNWGARNRLDLLISNDNALTWRHLDTPAFCPETIQPDGRKSEFSYPALIALSDGGAALCCTWHRQTIHFFRYFF